MNTRAETASCDTAVRRSLEAGDPAEAVTLVLETHGSELLGYLFAVAPSPDVAEELYAELCEHIWRGLPRFRFASSVRTWTYTIARNLLRDEARRRRRNKLVAISDAPEVAKRAEAIRTSTLVFLRTEMKDRLARIRNELSPDDRTLLILRVDRQLPWRDIAIIMGDAEADPDPLVPRLRKRFQRLKQRLRAALEAG
jgi:RNA polymerase sigma-70 factor, ECF subfamily